MRFWFDRTVPKRLAALIGVFDIENEICHFSQDERVTPATTDVELAALLSNHEDGASIVVTIEIDQLRHSSFGAAVALTSIRHIVLTHKWTEKDFCEQAWRLLRLWPSIVKVLKFSEGQIISVSSIQTAQAFERSYLLNTQSVNSDAEEEE